MVDKQSAVQMDTELGVGWIERGFAKICGELIVSVSCFGFKFKHTKDPAEVFCCSERHRAKTFGIQMYTRFEDRQFDDQNLMDR